MSTKTKLLEYLEQNKGSYLSGEKMAEDLHISRAAVWKGIKSLREDGYEILAVTNKGYALLHDHNILMAKSIDHYLEKKDVEIYVFQEISSTNQKMKQMAIEKRLPHGSFVVANQQKNGRGRRGRSFFSPENSGLYLSVVLYPKKTVNESLKITASAAVAVLKAVRENTGKILGIKWVNDLYLEEKKVCGILTEAVTDFETGDIEFVVVGIGLNLYEPESGFPKELREKAGAILTTDEKLDRNQLTASIVNHLLREIQKEGIPKEYIENNIVPGRWINILSRDKKECVFANEILDDGRLVITRENNTQEILTGADVSLEL